MIDHHRFYFTIAEFPRLRVVCPYTLSDPSRPCWPTVEVPDEITGGSKWEPASSPQNECTYATWINELSWSELIHGEIEVEIRGRVSWALDMLHLTLGEDNPLGIQCTDPKCAHRDIKHYHPEDQRPPRQRHFVAGETRHAVDTESV